ncbi:MAG: hypothetical protein M1814_000594 [Vezdaea aestivalis]|nr:MAG: hypothetical protein M1814_000594 [Vezdaea aestivalis]
MTRIVENGYPNSAAFWDKAFQKLLREIDESHEAVSEQHLDIVRFLFQKSGKLGKNSHMFLKLNKSPILYEVLLKAGWDINSTSNKGFTHLTSNIDDEVRLKWFLENGADPNIGPDGFMRCSSHVATCSSGINLDSAAAIGSVSTLNLLLAYGAKLENSHTMVSAADTNDDESKLPMMRRLVELGVDVNQLDSYRQMYSAGPALHLALRN